MVETIKFNLSPSDKNAQTNTANGSKSWITNSRLYTAREYDQELDLYYYRGRSYDARIGRFIQRDPIGYADDVNLYTYVGNNPMNYVDPWGLKGRGINAGNKYSFNSLLLNNNSVKTNGVLMGRDECGGAFCRAGRSISDFYNMSKARGFSFTLRESLNNSDFLNGLTEGDAAENQNRKTMAGQYVGGELAGPVADSRDMAVSLNNCKKNGVNFDCGVNVVANGFSYIPIAGSILKPVIKVGGNALKPAIETAGTIIKRGANHPAVQQAIKKGKEMHKVFQAELEQVGYKIEKYIKGFGRADAVNFTEKVVVEIKPNNQKAINKGLKQLDKYVEGLSIETPGDRKKIIKTY